MSDSITGSLADLAKETVKQAIKAPLTIAKGVPGQIIGTDSEEELLRKKAEKMMAHQRIKEIEAEMEQIRKAGEKKQSNEAPAYKKTLEQIASKKAKKMDEVSRQAVGKTELGRNFKG